jgi:hypothetical protein
MLLFAIYDTIFKIFFFHFYLIIGTRNFKKKFKFLQNSSKSLKCINYKYLIVKKYKYIKSLIYIAKIRKNNLFNE